MKKRSKIESLERSDLRAHFEAGFKAPAAFGLGIEYERFGILDVAGSQRPLPIEGPLSVAAVLEGLVARFGWQPTRAERPLIELARGPSRITLEPGGQMELSGAVHPTLAGIADELGAYLREVREVSMPLGIRWVAAGTHPTALVEEIAWLPKKRYALMKLYLPAKGQRAHQMMKATCGAQVNLDFSDEADAMVKFRASMGLTAVVAAMFASSPITAGKANGFLSERGAVWADTDPDRCGLLPFAFSASASFDDYIDWALSVPMIFLVRSDRWTPLKDLTFGRFLEHGHDGERATLEDWTLHLSSLFPDVRLKAYIEVRGTDSNPPGLVLAHAALWKGILYGGPDILAAAYATVAGLSWSERLTLRRDVARLGLRAEAAGRPVLEIARELIALAEAGLASAPGSPPAAPDRPTSTSAGNPALVDASRPPQNAAGNPLGDASYLEPLKELTIRNGTTPAEEILRLFHGTHSSARSSGLAAVLDRAARLDPFD